VEDERRWGFEEAEDWEYAAERRVDPPRMAEQDVADSSTGVDDSGAVTVVVGPDGQVRAVTLAADWRRALDPRALGASVLSAANNATMQALARSIEADQPAAPQPTVNATAPTDSLITRENAIRLMDAVTAERAMPNVRDMSDASVTDGDGSDWKLGQ
jgi:DNA-binding protein YbaB